MSGLDRLKAPFAPADIEWRVQASGFSKDGKPWARIVPYITNRAIQDRLDEVVGAESWRNEYVAGPQGGVLCGISIFTRIPDREPQWVTKWDGAENTDIEGVKGGLSGSMKRAAVQWGIGRFLYDMGEAWADFVPDRTPDAHMAEVKTSGGEKKRCWWRPPFVQVADPPPPERPAPATAEQLAKIRELAISTGDLKAIESKLGKLTQQKAGEWIAQLTAKAEREKSNV